MWHGGGKMSVAVQRAEVVHIWSSLQHCNVIAMGLREFHAENLSVRCCAEGHLLQLFRKGKCISFWRSALTWQLWYSGDEPRPVQCSQANETLLSQYRLGKRDASGCQKQWARNRWMYGSFKARLRLCLHTCAWLRHLQIWPDVQRSGCICSVLRELDTEVGCICSVLREFDTEV